MAEPTVTATALDRLLEAVGQRLQPSTIERLDLGPVPCLTVPADHLVELAEWLRAEQGYNTLLLVTGCDRLDRFEVTWLLDALPEPPAAGRLALRVTCPRDAAEVPSLCAVWPAANWLERETWDLLGIRFTGHPDLRRIFLPDYWEGYPLRKDYRYDANTMVDKILDMELGPEGDSSMAGLTDSDDPAEPIRRSEHGGLVTQEVALNMGPQHPSTHGVLRLRLKLDGEYVRVCDPDLGFLHRSFEKLAECKTYVNGIPLTDRWDYLDAMGNNMIHCLAVEQLLGLEVPERVHWIRMLVLELNRIASHLVFVGTYGLDVGAASPFLHCFRDRERILDMFELLCGARLTYNYIRIGGVSADLPRNFISDRVRPFLDYFHPARLDEVNNLLTGNEVFRQRTIGVGVWSAADCIAHGLTGPLLRASGVGRDVRRVHPYARYEQLEFDVPVGERGDCYDRYLVRVAEMGQSVRLLRQICDWFEAHEETRGEFQGRLPKSIKPPVSETYAAIETPRGELGLHLIADGTEQPYRYKIRRPSFCNLSLFPRVARDQKVADLVAILGTTDIVMGEVDG